MSDDPTHLAPVLGARRDRSATVDSARSLLMTVLGEFVLPGQRSAWTQTLISVLEALGVRDKAARQAIARMTDHGWLERERIGRQTLWTLTPEAVRMLESGAARIYGFHNSDRQWDGRWLVLMASVPERDRQLRYRMGIGLSWAGFGSLGQGTWVSPWIDQEVVAVDLVGELELEATSFVARMGGLGSGTALVAQAWDLPTLRAEYEEFLVITEPMLGADLSGLEAVAQLTLLVHRWRRFPFMDPDLPSELLPADWPATDAAERFAKVRSELTAPAADWWTTANP